jgi:class 3 adenylate cyclase/tetratricopeptide (TPR) repeat protein
MDTSVPQGTGNPGVIFCPKCGQQNPQSNRFCGQCGNPLPATCPSCGAANPAGNRFCGTCGSALSAPTPSSIDASSSPQPSIPSGSAGSNLVERERRLVTVLFCDLVGFTPLSERLDPEDVREIQTMYFGRMSKEIRTFGGTVEKYIGDAVLAMFGVPVAHEDDAVRAIRCGLSMQAAITSLAIEVGKQWGVELALRVGVNTGEVVSGQWEVAGRKEYDVSGDAVNTAARLQTAAAPGEVLVGEETMWLARKAIRFGERREVTLKGKSGVVPVYAAVELREGAVAWGPRTPLVDRHDELALLKSMWVKVVREERPHFVTLLGDPGIGKSRLVAEFEASVLHEALVLHGRCLPYGEVLGYWALADVLKEATGITTADDTDTAYRKLGLLVVHVIGRTEAAWDPLEITRHLALLSGLDVEVTQPAIADQRALHMSVRHFIEALAHRQPLCVLFDDLHWADDALLDLIEFLAARVHGAPLLILAQARPELLEKRPAWGRGIRHFTPLSLEPLDEPHGHELVLKLCWEHGLSEDVAERIGHGAAGNPLFAEELVATIAERGGTTGVPSAIKALISARLDALLPEERRAIQLAAVIGKVFWEGGLRTLGASGNVTAQLEALEQKDLLRSQLRSQFRGDREYAFKHDLIRDVAYEMLSRADRRLLHSRVADWIEAISGERLEEYLDLLAHHAVRADQPERALDYLTRAAERAERAAAHREEATLLAQAIDIAERTGRRPLVAGLQAKRGKAFRAVAMWREASQELELALAGLTSEQVEQRIQVLIDLTEVRFWLQDLPGTRRYATEALALAEEIGRDDLAGGAMGALALADGSDGAVQASLDQFQHTLGRVGKNLPTSLFWFEFYGLTLYWTGNYEAAIERSREAIESARKSHDTTTIARALGNLGMALTGRGRYDEALQVFAEARQFAREYDTGTWLARSTAMCGGLHLELFDFARAEALAEEAREISRSLNWPVAMAGGGIDLLLNFARCQQVGRAEPLLPEVAEAAVKAQGAHSWLWKLRLAEARAEIALARGEWEEAMRWADDAIAQSVLKGRVKYQAAGLETRAKALAALGRKHEAIAGLHRAVELVRPVGDPAMFLRVAASLLVLDGDDALLAEARSTARRIIAALPDEEMTRCFTVAEPVRVLGTLTP